MLLQEPQMFPESKTEQGLITAAKVLWLPLTQLQEVIENIQIGISDLGGKRNCIRHLLPTVSKTRIDYRVVEKAHNPSPTASTKINTSLKKNLQ